MAKSVVVKKYGNRRLYDSTHSRYVNLDELAQMVRDGVEVSVVDAKTGEDLTRLVLTQIILDDARRKRGDLPLDFLRQMIAAEGKLLSEFFRWYGDTVLQAGRRLPFGGMSPSFPAALFGMPASGGASGPTTAEEALRREVAALSARLEALETKGKPPARRRKPKSPRRVS